MKTQPVVKLQQQIKFIREYAEMTHLHTDCFPDGDVAAEVVIIGESITEREAKLKTPLVGGVGQLIWNHLRAIGIRRTDCYVTHAVKRSVVYKDGKPMVSAEEQSNWEILLRKEISNLPNAKIILILGNAGLTALTGEKSVTAWRGSVIPVTIKDIVTHENEAPSYFEKTYQALVSYSPMQILRDFKLEPVFVMDTKKLRHMLDGTYTPHDIEHITDPTAEQAHDWISKMDNDDLPISFDIETMGNETACVGFANDPHYGMCINWRDLHSNKYPIEVELKLRRHMQQLFSNTKNQFIAQNGMFDMTWLWYKDKMRPHAIWFDTMLAHHTMYPQLPHNLGFLTAQYTNHPYYKDDGKVWRHSTGNIDEFWRYNVKDCCITLAAAERMQKEIVHHGQEEFFYGHVMRLQKHLALMCVGGLRVDEPYKEALTEELKLDVAGLREQFVSSARVATKLPDINPNPNSSKQLSELFFKELGLVGRGTSTDEKNRMRILKHPGTSTASREMITSLNKFAKERKFLSTYAAMLVDPDGRVRCEYKQTGVQSAPGRLSSSKVMWGSGGNQQNWPERAHKMVIADGQVDTPDEYVLVYFDLAQAEARVVGWEAQIPLWIEQFERARLDGIYDCHRALASDMFAIPYEDVPTYDREDNGTPTVRFIAKRCRHGLNYRMMAPMLAETTGLGIERAKEAYFLYHEASPELKVWWKALETEARTNRRLVSAKGRVLPIMERITDSTLEAMVAFKPQSTIGDHVASVIYKAHDDPKWPTHARMLLNIHDALIAIARIDQALDTAVVMKKHLEEPIMIHGNPLIIPGDCGVSVPEDGFHRWSSIRKVKHFDDFTKVLEAR